jgi:FkbM family methyltransferase
MQELRPSSAFARLVADALPAGEPLRLADIGGTGALEPGWRSFAGRLQVLAVADVDGPAPEPRDEAVRLVRHALGTAPGRPSPMDRLAEARALSAAAGDVEPLTSWLGRQAGPAPPDPPAPPGAGLAALLDDNGFGMADVLHLRTGAADLRVLRQLSPVLARPSLLAVAVRWDFLGGADPDENSGHNIDRLLRQHGFDLFVLAPVRQASPALPWPFLWPHPGASFGGRPVHAQAVYLRDPTGLPTASLLKAAALRALFNLPDQAAELLRLHEGQIGAAFDVAAGLDLLTAQIQEDTGETFPGYAAYLAAFERGDRQFYNLQQRQHDWMSGLQAFRRDGEARIRQLEDTVRDMANALHDAAAQAEAARARRLGSGRHDAAARALDRATAGVDARSRLYPGGHAVFDLYTPYRGPADPAFHRDFIGAHTLAGYGDWITPTAVDDYEHGPPPIDEEYFEWIDVLQAVSEAGPVFTMLELGAGYGRWSARAALAARQKGKAVRLGAAEAEPKHLARLEEHLRHNGVAPGDLRLFPQAVGGGFGEAAFTIGGQAGGLDDNWYGQAVMPLDLRGLAPVGEYHGAPVYEHRGWRAILVPVIPLSEVLKPYDVIDIVDFDLQGAEGDAIAEAIKPLTRKARRLHIGTHSEQIEAQLRDLLPRHGWVCLRDYSLHKTHDTPFGRCEFVDGVQSWVNPPLL